jgi:hypothetical protein
MPESSLTEEAAITPGGNVLAASTRVTHPDIHSSMELLVERDKSALIDGGQWMSLFVLFLAARVLCARDRRMKKVQSLPFRGVLSSHSRMSISASGTSRSRQQAPFPGRLTRP